jgi:hypothetical protein
VTNGSLVLVDVTPGLVSGITIVSGAQDSPSMTITGTVPNLNAALGSLAYVPNSGFSGSDSLQVSVTDPSDNLTGTATVPITVVPIVINAPQSWGVRLDQLTPIPSAASIVDNVASGTSDSVTVSVTHGTIGLGWTGGLTFTSGSNDSSSMTVNGTLASLNNALDGALIYKPNQGYLGSDALQISVVDANNNASATVAVPITVYESPPSIETPDTAVGLYVREDRPDNLIFQAFRTSDADAIDNSDFLTISATNGTIPLPLEPGDLIVTAGAYGSSSVTLNGPIVSLMEAADSGLRYTPNPGFSGPDTLQVSLYDSVDGLSASNSVVVSVSPGPAVLGPGSVNVPAQSPDTLPASSFSLIDAAATGTSDSLSLAVTYGSLTLGSTTGLTFTAGSNDSSSMTVSGTLANLNAALDGLVYSPNQSPTDTDDLSITLSDSGDNSSALSRTYIQWLSEETIFTPVEDISLNENTSFVFSNGSFSVLGAGSSTASFSLSVGDGTLALASTAGLTFNSGANNSSSMTVTGTLQNINLALNGLVYTPDAGYSGSDTLTCSINEPISQYSPTVPITINAPPSLTAPSTARVHENGVLPFPNGSVATSDAQASLNVNSDLLTLSVSHGNLTVLSIPGVTILSGANNSSSMTLIGTVADLNAAVAGLVYTPNPGFNGWDTLALSVDDQIDGLTTTTNVALAVDAAPSIQVPGPATVTENVPYTFSGSIAVFDATSSGTSDSLTLAVSHGGLTLGSTAGVSFVSGSNGTSSMTISGTLTNLNAALNGLVYTPNVRYTGPDSLQLSVNDAGDNLSGSAAVSITVIAPPAVTAPATASSNENASWTFSGTISLADAAASGTSDSLTLAVGHGTLTLGSTSGLTFSAGANGASSMTVAGTLANLNAALNGLIYAPNSGYSGADSLHIFLADSGDGLSNSATVSITVNAPPSIAAPATASLNENASWTFSGTIKVTDAAAGGNSDSLALSVAHGSLTLSTTGGLTFTAGANGGASFTVRGSVANLNAALSSLTYRPTANYGGSDSLAISISDPGDKQSASTSVALTVVAFAPPSISAPTNASLNPNGSLVFSAANGTAITVADSGPGSNTDSLTLTVTEGTLTLSTTSGLTVTPGANGSSSITAVGAVANLNAALSGLTYKPITGYSGSDSLAISLKDSADSLAASASVALTVSNPPAITAPTTAAVVITSTLTFSTANKNAVSISDVSAGSAVEPLTLRVVGGTLALGSTGGITFSSGTNNSASMTINGTLANLNAALSGLTFTPTNIGTATVVLAYTDVGDGLSASATITITVSKGITKLGVGSPVSPPPSPAVALGASFSSPSVNGATPASSAGDPSNSSMPPDEETTQWAGVTAAVAVLNG